MEIETIEQTGCYRCGFAGLMDNAVRFGGFAVCPDCSTIPLQLKKAATGMLAEGRTPELIRSFVRKMAAHDSFNARDREVIEAAIEDGLGTIEE